ncbi:MAG: aldo/keto reductase [Armatimonadota bacterium]|nr:aldo/keto reductase [bacterium]
MEVTRLGRTNLNVTRTAFGVLPLQRVEKQEAARILRRAYDAGITFYDTARAYTDSEEKIGYALSDVRDEIIIATKSGSTTKTGVLSDLEASLRTLKTDYIDIYQLHNPSVVPDPNDPESSYAALIEARDKGMVRFIGITNHSLERAREAIESGLFDTLQYPLCHISSPDDLSLIEQCKSADMGLIAMKPFSGGLITNARAAFAFFHQYENVVPIWGMQRMNELEEILALDANPPTLDQDLLQAIEHDRKELANDFCRACGYCLPCPADIPIPMAARMGLLLRRMPYQQFMNDNWNETMHRIENCLNCGHCKSHCPYGLDTPMLLKKMLTDYEEFYKEHVG